jgi:hypothetical protein
MAVLWINGKAMPDPALNGLTVSKEPVWSKNAGRGSTGKFIGDIVCYKFKLQIKWPVLSQKQTALINSAITSGAFFTVKFIDPTDSSGDYTTKTMYASAPSYPVYSYAKGMPDYVGTAVDLIEQ